MFDGSFEHYLFTQNVPICITSETPMGFPIKDRIDTQRAIMNSFMTYVRGDVEADWVGGLLGPREAAEEPLAFKKGDAWGYCVSFDLHDCDPALIRDPLIIDHYVEKLCMEIGSTPYGKPLIKRFGTKDKEGYSFVQLVTTSSITGHFSEDTNKAFIDIFFCDIYDPQKAVDFSKDFFKARSVDARLTTRA
jgi:S-adenosylmethionine/arginine decarboxylase-like enzyme